MADTARGDNLCSFKEMLRMAETSVKIEDKTDLG